MKPIKKMIIEETVNVLREMKHENDLKILIRDLYEAIQTTKTVKDNPKKYKVAKKIVAITEENLLKQIRKVNENNHLEDESEMAKAQLLAIMEKAKELYHMLGTDIQLEDWVQYKLSIAENYMDAIHGYMKYFNGDNDMQNDNEDEIVDDLDDEIEWDDVDEEDFDDDFEDDFDDEEFYDVDDFEDDFDDEETDEFDV